MLACGPSGKQCYVFLVLLCISVRDSWQSLARCLDEGACSGDFRSHKVVDGLKVGGLQVGGLWKGMMRQESVFSEEVYAHANTPTAMHTAPTKERSGILCIEAHNMALAAP